jgi:solute carrier family 40 (iron-regulated transporter), member 1
VDREPSRLRALLLTIVVNRLTLIACCLLWILLFIVTQFKLRVATFVVILGLGMVEKASRMANTLSMERDWVPTVAEEHDHASEQAYNLIHLNTVIRRIDISSKFLAPLAISSVVALIEPTLAAMAMGAFSAISMAVELWAAMQVWKQNRRLRSLKQPKSDSVLNMDNLADPNGRVKAAALQSAPSLLLDQMRSLVARMEKIIHIQIDGLKYYFSTVIWLPSVGVAILHASVLAWSGTLITWLLNAGFSLPQVTVAKGIGSIFEIGSTLVFPLAVSLLRSRSPPEPRSSVAYEMVGREDPDREEPSEDELDAEALDAMASNTQHLGDHSLHAAVVRVALWAIAGLIVCLIPTVIALFYLDSLMSVDPSDASPVAATIAAIAFFAFLSISFLGRWTYDLSVNQLTLMLVPASHRSSFGGTEMALVSTISLVHWTAAAIWHAQDDFRWLALGSLCAVGVGAVGYYRWSMWWLHGAVR